MSDDVGQMIEMPGSTHHTTNHPTPVNVSAAAHARRPSICAREMGRMALPFCSVSLRCVHGFHLWSPFPYFYDLRAMAEAVCLCLLRLDAARVTSATTSTALRS